MTKLYVEGGKCWRGKVRKERLRNFSYPLSANGIWVTRKTKEPTKDKEI